MGHVWGLSEEVASVAVSSELTSDATYFCSFVVMLVCPVEALRVHLTGVAMDVAMVVQSVCKKSEIKR